MPKHPNRSNQEFKVLTLTLAEDDLSILDKFRGELTRDAFIAVLLRIIETGAVSQTPVPAKKKSI